MHLSFVGVYRALVDYIGQKLTCRHCDEPDRIEKQCPRVKTVTQAEVASISGPTVQKQNSPSNEKQVEQPNIGNLSLHSQRWKWWRRHNQVLLSHNHLGPKTKTNISLARVAT